MGYPRGIAANIPFGLVNATSGAALPGATVSAAVVKDNGSSAAGAGTFTDKATGGYNYAAEAAEMDGDTVQFTFTASGAIPAYVNIKTDAVLHAGTAQAGGNTTITLDGGASGDDDYYKGASVSIVGGTGSGQNPRLITAYSGTTKVAAVAPQWVTNPDDTSVFSVNPNPGADVELFQYAVPTPQTSFDVGSVAGDSAAAILLKLQAKACVSVIVNDTAPSPNTFVVAAANGSTLGTIDNWYANTNATLYFTSGVLEGLSLPITEWDAANRRLTFSKSFPSAPSNGDSALIVGRSVS